MKTEFLKMDLLTDAQSFEILHISLFSFTNIFTIFTYFASV